MLYLLSALCLVKRRTVSYTHRTSRRKCNKSDDVHRYICCTAKDCPVFRVAFGCLFAYGENKKILVVRRRNQSNFLAYLIGETKMKKFLKLFFQRYENLIPLSCIIKDKKGGQRL